jgi:predicted permease
MQIALSFVLLVGAGLLIKTFQAMRTASPGFTTEGTLTTTIDAFTAGYDARRARQFQDELIRRVRGISGVVSAGFSAVTPFSYATIPSSTIAIDGYDVPRDQQLSGNYNIVGTDYFATLGIPILAGRPFTDSDDERGARVAIVDEAMAARFWRGANPVGSRLQMDGQWVQVVGVARQIKSRNLMDQPPPLFYVPLRQHPTAVVSLQIRTPLRPAAIRPALIREIRALDANIAPGELITMREQVDRTTDSQVVAVTMLTVFGAVALVLAAIGLYGVMAASVAHDAKQLALRVALGADAGDVTRLVLGRGLAIAAGGVAVGAAVAFETTRLMGYLLYEVSPRDPAVFAAAFFVVVLSAAAACLVPILRATHADPVLALRG